MLGSELDEVSKPSKDLRVDLTECGLLLLAPRRKRVILWKYARNSEKARIIGEEKELRSSLLTKHTNNAFT